MPINIFWDDEHERNPSWCLYIENNWKQLTDPQNLFWKKAKFVFFDIRRCRLKFLTWYKPIVSVLETAALWPGCVAHFLYPQSGRWWPERGRWWDGPHTGIAHHAPQRKLAIITAASLMIPLTPMKACFVSPMRNLRWLDALCFQTIAYSAIFSGVRRCPCVLSVWFWWLQRSW